MRGDWPPRSDARINASASFTENVRPSTVENEPELAGVSCIQSGARPSLARSANRVRAVSLRSIEGGSLPVNPNAFQGIN